MSVPTLTAFRLATPEDAPAIGAFQIRAWRENYSDLVPSWMVAGFSVEERTAAWRQILKRPSFHDNAFVILTCDADGIAALGAASGQRAPKLKALGYSAQIEAMYVRRDLQHIGIGRSLLGRLFVELGARGHRSATHWLMRNNGQGARFLEATGAHLLNLSSNTAQPDGDLAYGWRDIGRPDRLSWKDPRSRLGRRAESTPPVHHAPMSLGRSADLGPERRRPAH